MSFALPWLLAALVGVPWWLHRRRRALVATAEGFPPLQLAGVRARGHGLSGLWGLLALEGALMACAIVAVAGPQRAEEVSLFEEDGVDMALVLDVSSSMQAADLPPNRLEVLKRLASELVRRRSGDRVGVYAFAGFCATQTPFTTDTASVVELLEGLGYEVIRHQGQSGGTAIGDALLIAADDLAKVKVEGRDQVVLLVTDGENNQGSDPLRAARLLRAQGIRLYVVGIGQDTPVPVFVNGAPFINVQGKHLTTRLDDRQLREIAALAEGRYYRADSTNVLARIFEDVQVLEHRPIETRGVQVKRSIAPWFALALGLLFAAWLGLDGLWLRRPLR